MALFIQGLYLRPWETERIPNYVSGQKKINKIECRFDCGKTEGRQVVTIPGEI